MILKQREQQEAEEKARLAKESELARKKYEEEEAKLKAEQEAER